MKKSKTFYKNLAVLVITLNENNSFYSCTIKAGSECANLKDSATELTRTLRSIECDNNNKVIKDFELNSLSAVAGFISGSNVNARQYLREIYNYIEEEQKQSTNAQPVQTSIQVNTNNEQNAQTQSTNNEQRIFVLNVLEPVKDFECTTAKVYEEPKTNEENNEAGFELTLNENAKQVISEKYADIMTRLHNLLLECDFELDGSPVLSNRINNNLLNCTNFKEFKNQLINYYLVVKAPNDLIEILKNKLKCEEAKQIYYDLQDFKAKTKLMFNLKPVQTNKRLTIFIGGAGTGKTTKANALFPNAEHLTAKSDIAPSELFTKINPVKMCYELTSLGKAITQGKTCIIDEFADFNKATSEVIKSITDNSKIVYDSNSNQYLEIKAGFQIVATMNLTNALGSALASRAKIVNFDLEAHDRFKNEALRQFENC